MKQMQMQSQSMILSRNSFKRLLKSASAYTKATQTLRSKTEFTKPKSYVRFSPMYAPHGVYELEEHVTPRVFSPCSGSSLRRDRDHDPCHDRRSSHLRRDHDHDPRHDHRSNRLRLRRHSPRSHSRSPRRSSC